MVLVALDPNAIASYQPQHAKDIENRLVHTVRCQFAEAGEVRLILKLKSPGDNPLEIDIVFLRQLVGSRRSFGDRDSIKRSVAVTVLRPLTSGTPFGVAFSQKDRGVLPHRERRNDLHTAIHREQLGGDAHPHVSIHEFRTALGMKADEVERCAYSSGGSVPTSCTVFQELAQESAGFCA